MFRLVLWLVLIHNYVKANNLDGFMLSRYLSAIKKAQPVVDQFGSSDTYPQMLKK